MLLLWLFKRESDNFLTYKLKRDSNLVFRALRDIKARAIDQ